MKKYILGFEEYIKLNESLNISKKLYYHSTSNSEKGEKILKDGFIKPGNLYNNSLVAPKGQPMYNRVYFASRMEQIYPNVNGGWVKGSGIGYLFEIDITKFDNDLILPDEDEIGYYLSYILDSHYNIESHNIKGLDDYFKAFLIRNLSESEKHKILKGYDDFDLYKIAKKLILKNKVTFSRKNEIFIENKINMSIEGNVKFSKVYTFDKSQILDYKIIEKMDTKYFIKNYCKLLKP